MIGFDSFILMNDNSTDSTQCLLDAYAQEGVVIRYPQDLPKDVHHTGDHGGVFDACTEYLASIQRNIGSTKQQIWMATHDTDEFIWFNQTATITSLQDAIHDMIQSRPYPTTHCVQIPRLKYGSSRRVWYEDEPVIERFTHRFNHDKCVRRKDQKRHSNELFDRANPPPYCSSTSYEGHKSISLVLALAQSCVIRDDDAPPGSERKVRCHTTHDHLLENVEDPSQPVNAYAHNHWDAFVKQDSRYMNQEEVGSSKVAIAHYLTKSREEFYQRICSSQFKNKYFKCPGCTPETFFNYSETYRNNFYDGRMMEWAHGLSTTGLASLSTTTSHCQTKPETHSWEYYRNCWMEAMQNKK